MMNKSSRQNCITRKCRRENLTPQRIVAATIRHGNKLSPRQIPNTTNCRHIEFYKTSKQDIKLKTMLQISKSIYSYLILPIEKRDSFSTTVGFGISEMMNGVQTRKCYLYSKQ